MSKSNIHFRISTMIGAYFLVCFLGVFGWKFYLKNEIHKSFQSAHQMSILHPQSAISTAESLLRKYPNAEDAESTKEVLADWYLAHLIQLETKENEAMTQNQDSMDLIKFNLTKIGFIESFEYKSLSSFKMLHKKFPEYYLNIAKILFSSEVSSSNPKKLQLRGKSFSRDRYGAVDIAEHVATSFTSKKFAEEATTNAKKWRWEIAESLYTQDKEEGIHYAEEMIAKYPEVDKGKTVQWVLEYFDENVKNLLTDLRLGSLWGDKIETIITEISFLPSNNMEELLHRAISFTPADKKNEIEQRYMAGLALDVILSACKSETQAWFTFSNDITKIKEKVFTSDDEKNNASVSAIIAMLNTLNTVYSELYSNAKSTSEKIKTQFDASFYLSMDYKLAVELENLSTHASVIKTKIYTLLDEWKEYGYKCQKEGSGLSTFFHNYSCNTWDERCSEIVQQANYRSRQMDATINNLRNQTSNRIPIPDKTFAVLYPDKILQKILTTMHNRD